MANDGSDKVKEVTLEEAWKAVGLHMLMRGEQLYPEWTWDLYVGEPTGIDPYIEWCCDEPRQLKLVVAIKAHCIRAGRHGRTGRHGTVIEVPKQFVSEFLSLANAERVAVEDAILTDVIRSSSIVNHGGRYPVLSARVRRKPMEMKGEKGGSDD